MSSEPAPKDDWAAQLTEKVGQLVELVRDHTVRPVEKLVRTAIFGALAFSVVIFVLIALVIGVIRLLNNEVFDQPRMGELLVDGRNLRGDGDVDLQDAPQPELTGGRYEGKATQMESGAIARRGNPRLRPGRPDGRDLLRACRPSASRAGR